MKLFHISDLHLGKRVSEFSLLEDQAYILEQILSLVDREKPHAVLVAGDVYDKAVPGVEAVRLWDYFLWQLATRGVPTLIISGNHDSPERMAFGERIMCKGGVYLAPVFDGTLSPITLTDEHGDVDFYLLPFVKPVHVRQCFPDAEIATYTDAIRHVVSQIPLRTTCRNVLLAHQFVAGALSCDSEDIVIGGLDHVDVSVFDPFDYVALGHLHSPQGVGCDALRYCGSPLKYSFSESEQTKSVTCIQLAQKGEAAIQLLPLTPLREMRTLRASFQDITATPSEDYVHVVLTDEDAIPDAASRLRAFFPNLAKLSYDNARTRTQAAVFLPRQVARQSPLTLFCEFYEAQNGRPPSPQQAHYLTQLVQQIWEGGL